MTEHDAMYRTILMHPEDNTPRRIFADFLEENGELELSEFVRVQCLILRLEAVLSKPFENQDHCTDLSANWCGVCGDCCCPHPEDAKCDPRCPLHSPDSRHHSDDSLKSTLNALRSRERELFTAHGREWFGENVGLDRPTPLQLSIAALAGCGWLVPARGFPAHWYGSWEHWVGGECIRCDGDGRAHGADRPFEWSADVEYGKCVVCKGSGRITGACETLAWRPTWEMECGNCGGFGEFRRRHDNGDGPEGPCPECGGKWLSGPFLDPDDYWDSGSGRVPRPCPQGAVPLTDVTLTTMPDMEWMIAASVRHSRVISNDHKAQCEAEWPGLAFHLPANRGLH